MGGLFSVLAMKNKAKVTDSQHASLLRVVTALNAGRLIEAERLCAPVLKKYPRATEAWTVKGMLDRKLGRQDAAIQAYHRAIELSTENADAWGNLGNILREQGNWTEAAKAYSQAEKLRPDALSYRRCLAECWRQNGELTLAKAQQEKILQQLPGDVDALKQLALIAEMEGNSQQVIERFNDVILAHPDDVPVRVHRAKHLEGTGQLEAAIADLQRVIELRPDHVRVMNNLGALCIRLQRYDEANAWFERALGLGLREPVFLKNYGLLLVLLRRVEEALPPLEDYLAQVGFDPNVMTTVALIQSKLCRWDVLDKLRERLLLPILQQLSATEDPPLPFTLLVLPLEISESEQRLIAERFTRYVLSKVAPDRFNSRARRLPTGKRVRLGYLSADFHNHATAHLMLGVFKRHDRERFEVFAYSLGPDDGSFYRQRIANEVDHFVDMFQTSDLIAADRIAADQIDVLIDLKGYTQNSRAEILAQRPAPIQAQYLGYPGTMGAGFIDYLITDRTVTPPEAQQDYTECFAYLPHCYQVNDNEQVIATHTPSREECGLPVSGFVFCCFCGHQKIDAALYERWMGLLLAVPSSVLWLIEGLPEGQANLQRYARSFGVSPDRIVFAKNLPKDEHLARHAHADLFLDTYYYNAHTTASDALWAGVPVITCPGNTFASRVGASLLKAIEMDELIVTDLAAYELLALALARNPQRLADIKQRLKQAKHAAALFDTGQFVKDFEQCVLQMVSDYQATVANAPPSAKGASAVSQTPSEAVLQRLGSAWQDYQRGEIDRALTTVQDILNSDPRQSTAWVLKGIIAKTQGDFKGAESAYQRAAECNPEDGDAWFNLSNLLKQQGRRDEAITAARRASAIRRAWVAPLLSLAELMRDGKEFNAALNYSQRASLVAPENIEVWINLGNTWYAKEMFEDAFNAYGKGLAIDPFHIGCLVNSALALEKMGRYGSALVMAQRVLSAVPRHRQSSLLKARMLRMMGHFAQERKVYLDWVAVDTQDDEVKHLLAELGNAQAVRAMNQDRPLSAGICIDEAVAYAPENATYHFNRALVLLHNGEYKAGFEAYEWRLKLSNIPPHPSRYPIWQGEPLLGKTILLHNEQGFGDALQFIRFAPRLVELGARVLVEVQPELKSLIAALPWVAAVVSKGDAYPAGIDFKLSILSLPHRLKLGVADISPPRYLYPDPQKLAKWDNRLGDRRPRVGMVWAGSPTNATEHLRAPGLGVLSKLWSNGDIQFVLIQKGGGRQALDGMTLPANVTDVGDEISDFSDTAAIMDSLDLMISSDTSTAHLAGALGGRLWVALFHAADWRWIEHDGHSVWYPNAKLFRQPVAGDWDHVVDQMSQDLAQLSLLRSV